MTQKITPRQEADFLDIVAQAIAERERISSYVSLDALCNVCKFYAQEAQQTALDVYFYLRNGEENRAMVHQFREHVRSAESELHKEYKNVRRKLP